MPAAIDSAVGAAIEAVQRASRARTNQPVWRHSRHQGEVEDRLWRVHNMFGRDQNNARMAAAEELERSTRKARSRNGALGTVALELLRFMLKLRSRNSGRLEPSIRYLAAQLRRSTSAIAAALKRLKTEGFLDWQRRTAPVADPQPGGQYVQQITNAYFLELRGRAAQAVRRICRAPTEATRRRQAANDLDQRAKALEGLTGRDLAAKLTEAGLPSELASTLAAFSFVQEGDSSSRNE